MRFKMKQRFVQRIQEYGEKPGNFTDIRNLIQDNTLLAPPWGAANAPRDELHSHPVTRAAG